VQHNSTLRVALKIAGYYQYSSLVHNAQRK